MSKETPKADALRAMRIAAAESHERMAKRAIEKREKKAEKKARKKPAE